MSISAAILVAITSFVAGFVLAWVFGWSAATRAISRQADRNLRQVGELNAQIRQLREDFSLFGQETFSRLEEHLAQHGPDAARAVPGDVEVRVYTSDFASGLKATTALEEVLESFGFEVRTRDAPVPQSWFQRFRVAFKVAAESPQAHEALSKAQRAVELQALDKHQAEVDSRQGTALAKLIDALSTTDQAVLQVGSLILLKFNRTTVSRNLTHEELAHIEKRPHLFKNPEQFLEELHTLRQQEPSWRGSEDPEAIERSSGQEDDEGA